MGVMLLVVAVAALLIGLPVAQKVAPWVETMVWNALNEGKV